MQVSPLPFDNGRARRSLTPYSSSRGSVPLLARPVPIQLDGSDSPRTAWGPLPEPPHPHPMSLVWDCSALGVDGAPGGFLFFVAPPRPHTAGSYGAEPPSSPAVPKPRRGLAAQATTRVALDDVGWLHVWTAAGFSRAYPPRCPARGVQEWVASGRCPCIRPCADPCYAQRFFSSLGELRPGGEVGEGARGFWPPRDRRGWGAEGPRGVA